MDDPRGRAAGESLTTPITQVRNPALVYDSRAEGLLVYLKDLAFDAAGHPVILFLTSQGYESGPGNSPRRWQVMRWTGSSWERHPITTSLSISDFPIAAAGATK